MTTTNNERAEFEAWLSDHPDARFWNTSDAMFSAFCGGASLAASAPVAPTFQQRVQPWLLECFGEMIACDREERNHRFLEESLELVQSCGCTASEAHQLVDYVYGRPVGEPVQEVGGVMVTLAALCLANGLDMHTAAETELARIWTKVDAIRAKQAAKPKHSPLPEAAPVAPAPQPAGFVWVPVKATQALLRPFYECPPDELELAWQAMVMIAGAAAPKAEPEDPGPFLDDDGRAEVVNSHHYTPENIRALVAQLRAFSDPQQTTQAVWDALDWRAHCNVLWRVMSALADEVVPATPLQQGKYLPLPPPDTHCHDEDTGKDVWSHSSGQMYAYVDADRAVRGAAQASPAEPAPIDMVLHCPKCGLQHVDKPEGQFYPGHTAQESVGANRYFGEWDNPPHRSHLCHGCGHIWRPADVPTNGVAAVKTKGKADSVIVAPPAPSAQDATELPKDILRAYRIAYNDARESGLSHETADAAGNRAARAQQKGGA